MTLSVEDDGQSLGVTALVERSLSGERICGYMQRALESLAQALETAPSTPVQKLEILPPGERTLLLETWNATEKEYPEQVYIHELFEEQVSKTPDAVAVTCGEESLSYGQLNREANRLAHYLIGLGVKAEERVGICVERGIGMVIGAMGVLKAGGAYVPLDPGYPVERLRFMLEDSEPVVLLTQGHVLDREEELKGVVKGRGEMRVVDLSEGEQWAWESDSDPMRRSEEEEGRHLAYVIYTSGSTGVPKGVMVEHAGLKNYLRWASESYVPRRAVVSSPLSFDATVTSLYTPLLGGGTVHLLRDREEVEGLYQQLQGADSCGLVKITPRHLDVLGQQLTGQGGRAKADIFVVGGEALGEATVQLWRQIAPGVRMVNEYGPTETVVGCVGYEIEGGSQARQQVPIGRPIANTRVYILDGRGEPVPVGAVGEIYIGGAGVARGYRDRAEMTAERFVPDDFSSVAGARMYKTGDLGRYLGDGNIEFLGRNDHQVKIRGYRIELGEIEAQLLEHELVKEAVVVAREEGEEEKEKRLVAYVVVAEGEVKVGGGEGDRLQEEAGKLGAMLRAHLAGRLPEYMVPSAYVRLEQMPLTPNGKVDRKVLPAPEGGAYAQRSYEPPQGETEEVLANLWQEVLGVERVGRHDHFFELGGHSLLAMRLQSRIWKVFGVELPMGTLFASPVLTQLAEALTAAGISQRTGFNSFDQA